MADISYTPTVLFSPYVNGETIVSAEGPDGFNARFDAIKGEFDKISSVIAQIDASLVIVPPSITLTFAPTFFPNGADPPWLLNNGIAIKNPSEASANGWMQLQLPDGTQLQTMTILGAKSGNVGSFQVQLVRQSAGAFTLLLAISLANQPDTFEVTEQVPANLNQVDNSANKYLVIAKLVGAGPAPASASLTAIQIVCKRA